MISESSMEVTLLFLLVYLEPWLSEALATSSNETRIRRCPPFPSIPHVSFEYVYDENHPHSSTRKKVKVECLPGYQLDGKDTVFCMGDHWDLRYDPPECNVGCGQPAALRNGRYSITGGQYPDGSYKKNTLAIYYCNQGYVLATLTAKYHLCENGSWSGTKPECHHFNWYTGCDPPENITNGYYEAEKPMMFEDRFDRYQRVQYNCNPGYLLIGEDTRVCRESNQWFPKSLPFCKSLIGADDIPCPNVPTVAHAITSIIRGFHTMDSVLPGTQVEIKCSYKFRDTAYPCKPVKLTCAGGQWVGPDKPNCVPVNDCPLPPRISHGAPYELASDGTPKGLHFGKYEANTRISYQCFPEYQIQGNYILTCTPGGCWFPEEPPVCLPVDVSNGGPIMISVATGVGVLMLLLMMCLAIVCRRRKPISRAVPMPVPPSRIGLADQALLNHPDRLALIAFADGVQVGQSILPSYEQAVRDERAPSILTTNRLTRPQWPSIMHRRTRNSPDVVHVVRHGSFASHSTNRSGGDPMGSTDTVVVSEGGSTAVTLDTASSHSGSQTASCRAHCGSLASFDTSSVHNTEGVPLLEESELEELQGDVHSLALENRSIADDVSYKFQSQSPDLV